MTDKVVTLRGGQASSDMVPVESCVRTLRDLLERAEAGEVVGVALACLHHDNDASYYVAGRIGGFSMQGALEVARLEVADINRGHFE